MDKEISIDVYKIFFRPKCTIEYHLIEFLKTLKSLRDLIFHAI